MPLIIEGVEVPYAVETGKPEELERFLANPKAWHEAETKRVRAAHEKDLRDALEAMTLETLNDHAFSLGIVPGAFKATGAGGKVVKKDVIEAVVAHQLKEA